MDHHFSALLEWLREHNCYPPAAERCFIQQHTVYTRIPKNTVIMEQGRPVNAFYFMNSGIARLFLKHNQEDITLAFISAPQFASTIIYLLNRVPSRLAIETCTDIEALQWDRDNFMAIREHTETGKKMETALTELLLRWNLEREIDRLTQTPEERYCQLIETSPLVAQQVPVKYIASYLGIHQDSLSRIRNRLMKRF